MAGTLGAGYIQIMRGSTVCMCMHIHIQIEVHERSEALSSITISKPRESHPVAAQVLPA